MRVQDRYLVDGFDPCDPVTQRPTVYEFHGCRTCFPRQRNWYPICHTDRTLQEVYESTQNKQEALRQRGYNIKVMWECDWDQELKTNAELRHFLDSSNHFNPETPSSVAAPMPSNCITRQREDLENRSSTST